MSATPLELSGKGINGLFNVHNSCYINTTVQCIGHCISFLTYVLSGEYERKEGCLLNELREVLEALWINDNGIIPNRFLKWLRVNIKELDIRDQNDIQEFLTLFIDKMNTSISVKLDVDSILSSFTYGVTAYDKLRKKVDKAWFDSVGREYSPIIDFFYGQSIVQIVCGKCNKIHHNYEPFSIFLLSIPAPNATLEECISHHVAEEYLNDEHSHEWQCDECKEKLRSLKTIKFWKLPRILTICLKRFTYDLRKNNAYVDIPEAIDLTDFVIGTSHKQYKLCSVACHIGSFSNGHYYALCKNPNGNWYRIDDTNIEKLGQFNSSNSMYMAFYEATD
jgi:ubiquitin carboxyl-terminal hydrolase 2